MEERTESATPPFSSFATATPVSRASIAKDDARKETGRKALLVGGLVAVVLVLLLALLIYVLSIDPARTANIRDIVIILVAAASLLISLAIGVLLVVLIFRVQELIGFLRGEVVPLLHDLQTTVKTVSGTTTFVSDNVAKPTIKMAGWVAGVQQMAKSANAKVRNRTDRNGR